MKILFKDEGYDFNGRWFKTVRFLPETTTFSLGYTQMFQGEREVFALSLSKAANIKWDDLNSFTINGTKHSLSFQSEILETISELMVESEVMIFERITDYKGNNDIKINTK